MAQETYLERLQRIKTGISNYEIFYNSLADEPGKHRNFSSKINIPFETLKATYELYLPNLVIECYTFSEQLLKEIIYSILGAYDDSIENPHLKEFIQSQMPKDRFSPDVKIDRIEYNIKKYRTDTKKYKMLRFREYRLSYDNYDELIKLRHRYAHSSNISCTINTIKESILFLEFLLDEAGLVCNNWDELLKIQKLMFDVESALNRIQEFVKISTDDNRSMTKSIDSLKLQVEQLCEIFSKLREEDKIESEIYLSISDKLNKLNHILSSFIMIPGCDRSIFESIISLSFHLIFKTEE